MLRRFSSPQGPFALLMSAFCSLLPLGASADSSMAPAQRLEERRPLIGLALSGGGARGAAHIGVLKVLQELRVPIDFIAGTSMGAVVGGAYAAGTSIESMQTLVGKIRTQDLFNDDPLRRDQLPRRRQDENLNYIGPEMGLRQGELRLSQGAVAGTAMEAVLKRLVGSQTQPDFDQLPIPFRALATDIESGLLVVLKQGDMATALRASMSLPGILVPAEIDGRALVDGGLTRNLPVDIVRAMGADIVIAVNLGTPLMKREQIDSLIAVTAQMLNILTEQNVRASLASLQPQDILIAPALGEYSAADFDGMASTIPIGEAAAWEVAERLKHLALPVDRYAQHRAGSDRPSEQVRAKLAEIRVLGNRRVSQDAVLAAIETRTGEVPDLERLDADVKRIFGSGDFSQVDYRLEQVDGREVLTFQVREKSWGPDYLRFGLSLSNDFNGNAYFQALGTYRKTWLNSLGAEWRTDVRLGRVDSLRSEFYQPVVADESLFVAPMLDFERKQIDVYDNDTRVAILKRRTSSLGFDIGTRLGRYGEVRAGVFRGSRQFELDTCPTAFAAGTGSLGMGGMRLRGHIDQLDSSNFPRRGFAASFDLVDARPGLGSADRYTRWEAEYSSVLSIGSNTVQWMVKGGGALGGRPLPTYDLFQSGGFLELSGYRSGQLIGQSLAFGRLVYARQLSRQTLLEGVFAGFSLEAGKVGSQLVSTASKGLRTAGSVFVGMGSPIGPIYLAYGQASGGSRALYLYLGRP